MKHAYPLAVIVPLLGLASGVLQAQPKEPAKEFTNSIGMKFVWIRPGTFLMGSPEDEEDRWPRETQHQVKLTRGFYLGVHPVTQEQWQAVMGKNPSHFKGEKNLPVECVSWEDCQEYLQKLSSKEGREYRLPTEAEWEYACRAGTTTPFHFGATISTDQANYNGNTVYGQGKQGVVRKKTTPVGSFPANAWGLFDMHGNVWQWCADVLADYPNNAVVDPNTNSLSALPHKPARIPEFIDQLGSPVFAERDAATKALRELGAVALPALKKVAVDGADLEIQRRARLLIAAIPEKSQYHVLRGGSFNSVAGEIRSAHRYRYALTDRYYSVGFRAALTLGDN